MHTCTATYMLARALLREDNFCQTYGTGYNYSGDGGREASMTGLGIYIVLLPFGDMKRYSGGGEIMAPESSSLLPCTNRH